MKMPRGITAQQVCDTYTHGLGEKYIRMCVKSKAPLMDYNFNKRGHDRRSMNDNRGWIKEVVDLTKHGKVNSSLMLEGLKLLNTKFDFVTGMTGVKQE